MNIEQPTAKKGERINAYQGCCRNNIFQAMLKFLPQWNNQ